MTTFYHGTDDKGWKDIQEEGVLWGMDPHMCGCGPRFTYLAPFIGDATSFGPVILAVEYEPTGIKGVDTYGFDPPEGEFCWQFAVFRPIDLKQVRRLTAEEVAAVEARGLNLRELQTQCKP